MSVEKLEALSPKMGTISTAVDTEEIVFGKMKSIFSQKNMDEIDDKMVKACLNFSKEIGKMRINQRSEVSIKTRIFKDVSKDQNELKMYIEASFPKTLKI